MTPKHGTRTRIFEMQVRGSETFLREIDSHIKKGGVVTILAFEECTVDNCTCELGQVMGPDARKHLVIRLDEADVAPLN